MLILFDIIIGNLKSTCCPTVRKQVSNNISMEVVKTQKVAAAIKRDPNRLNKWAGKSSMKLKSKCQILHLEKKKSDATNQVGGLTD